MNIWTRQIIDLECKKCQLDKGVGPRSIKYEVYQVNKISLNEYEMISLNEYNKAEQ